MGMAGPVPAYDYQQLAQALIANVAAAGVAPAAGAANAGSTAHYSGDHMDIERIESSLKKSLSDNCVDTNATVLQNIRTFLDHVSNVFKDGVVLYETRDDMERIPPGAVNTDAFFNMVTRPTRAQVGPVSRLVDLGRQAAAAAASPARPRPSSGASTPGDRPFAPVVSAPNTAGPASGTSSAHAASGASATPTRIADMAQDYVPDPGVLRGQDHGIAFLRSSKAGQRNEAKYVKYSKAITTRQYFALGGSAADWRYDLQHRYVRFTGADLQQRTNSLLELRTLPDDSLVNVFRMLDADGVSVNSPPLGTPVSGGDVPSWSHIAA